MEITAKYARAYARVSKRDKSRLLDEVVAVTGWSRDNARRRLAQAAKPGPRAVASRTRVRAVKHSPEAVKVLTRVWAISGGACGKYLAVVMAPMLDALERHGELVEGKGGYSPQVRVELVSMSPATIDRRLKSVKDAGKLRGASTTDYCY